VRTSGNVIAVCGDAAFTCWDYAGSPEQCRQLDQAPDRLLNDNEWVDREKRRRDLALPQRISTSPTYNKLHHDVEAFFKSFPAGVEMNRVYTKWKRETKDSSSSRRCSKNSACAISARWKVTISDALAKNLEFAKHCDVPVLVHVLTKKGKGLEAAVAHPRDFTGAAPYDPITGENKKAAPVTAQLSGCVLARADALCPQPNPKIVGITGAMPSGKGSLPLAAGGPISSSDGVSRRSTRCCSPRAWRPGFRPVCAIYSTFLHAPMTGDSRRSGWQNLPVTFGLDRAGLSPNDGADATTGCSNLAYLRWCAERHGHQPRNEDESSSTCSHELQLPGPAFRRYPRGAGTGAKIKEQPALLRVGHAECSRRIEHHDLGAGQHGPRRA